MASSQYPSIVSLVDDDVMEMDNTNLSNSSCPNDTSLMNSASSSDTIIAARLANEFQNEGRYPFNLHVIEPPLSNLTPSLYYEQQIQDTETDAAIALQLQEEEYSRHSILPVGSSEASYARFRDNINSQTTSDAQLAALLQEEENRNKNPLASSQPRRFMANRSRSPRASQHRSNLPVPNDANNHQHSSAASERNNDRHAHNNRDDHQHRHVHRNQDISNVAAISRLFESLVDQASHHQLNRNNPVAHMQSNDEDFGPDSYENLLVLDNIVAEKGLTKEQINRLPAQPYRRLANSTAEENSCGICMEDYTQRDTLRTLPCFHKYHKHCIDKWLSQKNLCPVCRSPVIK